MFDPNASDQMSEDALGEFMQYQPPILSEDRQREVIRALLRAWTLDRPHEVPVFMDRMRARKQEQSDRRGRWLKDPDKEDQGETVGWVPRYVAEALAMALGPDWWVKNPRMFERLWEEFSEGRVSFYEGTGNSKATLMEADRE